jgi:hypothetical protein
MILVAGPYRSGTNDDPVRIAKNVEAMTEAALQLFRAGHLPVMGEWYALPLIEHAGSKRIGDPAFNEASLIRDAWGQMRWLPSHRWLLGGADEMVSLAQQHGKAVYYSLADPERLGGATRTVPKRRLLAESFLLGCLSSRWPLHPPRRAARRRSRMRTISFWRVRAGCEDCYAAAVTRQTLEEVASAGGDSATILITTYERDSIWKVEQSVPLAAADVSASDRIVRLRGRRYRWRRSLPRRSFDCWRSRRARFQFTGSCRYPTGKCWRISSRPFAAEAEDGTVYLRHASLPSPHHVGPAA